jgi:hypothetical protein
MTARDAARLTCAGGVTGFALVIAPAGARLPRRHRALTSKSCSRAARSHRPALAVSGRTSSTPCSPPVTIGPLYASKAIELCAPGDPICSTGSGGAAHTSYTKIGLTDQAAAFVAGRV